MGKGDLSEVARVGYEKVQAAIDQQMAAILASDPTPPATDMNDSDDPNAGNNGDAPLLVQGYYDIARKEFLLQNAAGRWHSYDQSQFRLQLRARGFSTKPQEGLVSPAEAVMLSIQNRADVHYAGPLAGRKSGFYQENGIRMLITTSPEIRIADKRDWDDIRAIIRNVIASEQEPWSAHQWIVFNGWLKLAREALQLGKFQPGQALAFAGEVNSGKSLLQHSLQKHSADEPPKRRCFCKVAPILIPTCSELSTSFLKTKPPVRPTMLGVH